MAERHYDEEVVRKTFAKSKDTLLRRLPIHTLPSLLECESIISDAERSLITVSGLTSLQQREKLLDILLTKDSSALLKVLEILNTRECGYAELVGKLFADMDALQTDRPTKPTVPSRKQTPSSTSSDDPLSPAEKKRLDNYLKMKMDLEIQDVKSLQTECDSHRAIRLLYANALRRIIELLEPYLDKMKVAADIYHHLGLYKQEDSVKTLDLQTAESVSDLLSPMKVTGSWDDTTFLHQAVDSIPAKAIEREVAEAILSHYDFHLTIYKRATLLKDDLAMRSESDGDDEGTTAVATKRLVPLEIKSAISFTTFKCEDCHDLQVRLLSATYGIPENEIICHKVKEGSTTVTFLIPSRHVHAIMQHSAQLEAVWILLEMSIIEVSIPGVFTFSPSVRCFLSLLTKRKAFTVDLLRVTEILPYQTYCLIDLDTKEPLSGRSLSTRRIEYWPSHDELASNSQFSVPEMEDAETLATSELVDEFELLKDPEQPMSFVNVPPDVYLMKQQSQERAVVTGGHSFTVVPKDGELSGFQGSVDNAELHRLKTENEQLRGMINEMETKLSLSEVRVAVSQSFESGQFTQSETSTKGTDGSETSLRYELSTLQGELDSVKKELAKAKEDADRALQEQRDMKEAHGRTLAEKLKLKEAHDRTLAEKLRLEGEVAEQKKVAKNWKMQLDETTCRLIEKQDEVVELQQK